MASVEDYNDFGESLVGYVKASGSNAELQEAFKEGGVLHDAMETLKAQESELNEYQEALLESFKPGQENSLTQEQVNEQIEKNDAARNEIVHLRARLNELSESVGASKSNWATSRASDEFVKGVESGQKVDNGFFRTLIVAIKNAFTFTNKKNLEETKSDLKDTTQNLSTKKDDRVEIPSKEHSKAQGKSTGINSPTMEIEAAPATLERESKASVKDNIPPAPPPPPVENAGVKASNIPPAPPPPPVENAGVKASNIPPAPPPPPVENAGVKASNIPPAPSSPSVESENIRSSSQPESLLESIRRRAEERGEKKGSIVSKDHMNDIGVRDFVYSKAEEDREVEGSGVLNAIRRRMGEEGEKTPNNVLNAKDKQSQMNILYSAMVDGNAELIESLKVHQTEKETGEFNEWDEPILESAPTFSEEDLELVEKAVMETNARVERGEHLPSPEPEIEEAAVKVGSAAEEVSDIPPPPPPPPVEKVSVKKGDIPPPPSAGNAGVQQDAASLMDAIKGVKLKPAQSRAGSGLNMDGFTHKPTAKSDEEIKIIARRSRISGETLEDELESMSPQEQINTLYTAIIDDNQQKISDIYYACDEEVFTPDAIKKVCDAALKVAATQSGTKKIRIEKSVQTIGKEFDVELSVGKGQSTGRS